MFAFPLPQFPGLLKLVEFELARVQDDLQNYNKDCIFDRVRDYGEVKDMLPTKAMVSTVAAADISDIAVFDPNDGATDYFAALGPIYFFNANTALQVKQVYTVNKGPEGYGFTLGGNRPVWLVMLPPAPRPAPSL